MVDRIYIFDAKTVILDIDEDAAEKTAALANENGGNAIAIRVDYRS